MCFLAFLPSSAELQRIHAEATKKQRQEGLAAIRRKKGRGAGGKAHADGAEEDGNDTEVAAADFGAAIVENPVLKKGPATEHRRGWAPKRRFWVELRADSISFYPSSDKLYEPLGSVGFDDFEELSPVDWRKATRVTFRAAGKERELEFSTEEAALGWRREIEAALWKFRHTAEKIHVDIPLARIRTIEHHSFLSFAACVQVLVQDDKVTEDDDGSENVSSVTEITFGMTNAQAFFEDTIEAAACRTAAWRERIGWDRTLVATPRPIISVDGPTTKEAAEDHAPSDDEEELHLENADEMTAQKAGRFILFRVALVRTVPAVGSMSVNADHVCFWRRTVGSLADTKLRVPVSDLVQVETSKAFRWHHFGLTLHIKGHADLFFELNSEHERDDALRTIEKAMADAKDGHAYPDTEGKLASSKAKDAVVMDQEAVAVGPVVSHDSVNFLPKLVNPSAGQAPRLAPMRICIPVIGSRGDIQPFIALSKGLTAHGHSVCIVSHPEYEGWVSKHGIDFRLAGGDPGALMKLAVEHRLFSPAFFKESVSKFRAWLDELLREVFEGCYDADAIIEAPQTMAGIHIAERLGIPYFRAFTMPWTRTNAYPQAFSVPPVDMGTSYNSLSYTIFDQVFWRATSSQVNRWRKHMLGLKSTDFAKLDQDSVPFLYNFSGAVVPIPNDWDDHVCVSGYWFLDTLQNEWEAPLELIDFLEKAKADGKKIVYCGFGSIVVDDPAGLSQSLYEAVVKADVRAIIAKGWSGRMSEKKGKEDGEDSVKPPEECFVVDSIPHDWLFPRIDIAFHHGGAGTTGASIRAGLVTLIKPFFGDQFFWAQRVHKLGAGLRVASLDTSDICSALKKAAKSQIMIEKASQVGERIRAEHGVETAISFVSGS
ncbi:glycosyltransferase family 1 protein [Tilletiaria anomala UBC 951]|uniref:sterol 3beta-glucosyltransferase n=1 Tax=Tilletiaria anomala (strain ATCC 24038 / CBS 436.72 / UBC 951) TaxID=1037660 RepID=A0A066WE19_TILAU|nr:glycosyltransferase family 1 protein [Tilletiaria anomala UBC 951]KDN52001.1 glycosyltransferase family 1 protein [Tilletiaria anomala UBC 951]